MSHRQKNKHRSRHHTHAIKPANFAKPVLAPALLDENEPVLSPKMVRSRKIAAPILEL